MLIAAIIFSGASIAQAELSTVYNAAGACDRALSNDDRLVSPFVVPGPGQGHELVIHNGSRAPAFIKIVSEEGYRELFFAERGGTARSFPLPDGSYRIQYALGGELAQDCETVVTPEWVGEFPAQQFVTREDADSIEFSVVSFTLYSVRRGNVQPRKISISEFNKD